MSLDGFVTAFNVRSEEPMGDGGQRLHEWAFGKDERNRELLAKGVDAVGAVIAGRRTYDLSVPWWGADGPAAPARVPVFVVSRQGDRNASGNASAVSHYQVTTAREAGTKMADWKGLAIMNDNNRDDGTHTFDVVVTRVFGAPVEEVWKAWSDPAYVTRWWGPTGFTSPSAEMDFRVGGASLVCMRAPAEYGGQDMYNTWTYTSIVPHQRIEFVSNFANEDGTHLDRAAMGMPPGIPHDVPHEIVFKAAGEGGTQMTVTEHGYTTEQARDLSKAGMEQCLDKMGAIFG